MRSLRGKLAAAVGAAVVLGVLVVAGRLSSGGLQHPGSPTSVTTSLAWVPPPSTAPSPITAQLRFKGEQITAVVAGEGAVWVAHGCAISRVDPGTNRVVATVTGIRSQAKGCFGLDLGVGAGALWAVASPGGQLLRVDPRTMRVVATLAVASVAPPAATASGVWVVCCWRGITTVHPVGWLVRVDPRAMRVVARVRLGGLPDAVGVGPSGVWVTGAGGPIWRVDPTSNRVVATIQVPGGLGGLPHEGPAGEAGDVLVDSDAVWVSNPANAEALRIDPRRDRLQGRAFTGGPALVTADGVVWATSSTTLVPLDDPARREVPLGELGAPDQFLDEQGQLDEIGDLAAGADAVWVAAPAGLFRVDLARLR